MKIYGGSRADDVQLCLSCRAALVTKGSRMGDDRTFCRALTPARVVTNRVVECSDYSDRSTPTLYDFEQIAWWVTTSPTRKVGFVSPADRHFNTPVMPPSLPPARGENQ